MEQLQEFSSIAQYINDKESKFLGKDQKDIDGYENNITYVYKNLFNFFSLTHKIESAGSISQILQMQDSYNFAFNSTIVTSEIEENKFNSRFKLRNVDVKSAYGLKYIRKNAFKNCFVLGATSNGIITLPSSIIEIEDNAFDSCFMLKKIVFENENFASFGDRVFQNCINLEEIYFKNMVKNDVYQLLSSVKLMDAKLTDNRFYEDNQLKDGILIRCKYNQTFYYNPLANENLDLEFSSSPFDPNEYSENDTYSTIKEATMKILDRLFGSNDEINLSNDSLEEVVTEEDLIVSRTAIDIAMTDDILPKFFKLEAFMDAVKAKNYLINEPLHQKLKKYIDHEYSIINNKTYYSELELDENSYLPSSVVPSVILLTIYGIMYFNYFTDDEYVDILQTRIV